MIRRNEIRLFVVDGRDKNWSTQLVDQIQKKSYHFYASLFSNNIDWMDQKVKIIHRSHHHFSKTLQIQFNDIDYPTKKEKK